MRRLRKDTRNPLAVRRRDLLLGTAATILMAPAAMAQTVTAPQLARISHTIKRIGAPNQRKLLCHSNFAMI